MRFKIAGLWVLLGMVLLVGSAQAAQPLVYSWRASAQDFYAIYRTEAGLAGQGTQVVSLPDSDAWCPRVSPDGAKLAYVKRSDGSLWVANIDGSDQRWLTNQVQAYCLDWSSDGANIYYWGAEPGRDGMNGQRFYSIPAEGGDESLLFGGQGFICYFYNGGFEVWAERDQDGNITTEYIMFGASATLSNWNRMVLWQAPVKSESFEGSIVLHFLGDVYTPNRGLVDGTVLVQADHDGAGSHRIYRRDSDTSATFMSDLYAGNPSWNQDQTAFVFIRAGESTWGQTAYQGTLSQRNLSDDSVIALTSGGQAACPSFYIPASQGQEGETQ